MSTELVKSAAQRVRALLGQLEDPLAALDHITQGAEAHIAALAPSFAELEASPLENVPTFDMQQPAAKAFEPRPARRALEPSALQTESRRPVNAALPEVRSSAAAPGASPPTAQTTRVLPVSPRTALGDAIQSFRDSIRSSNESKANTLSRISEINRVAELIGEQQRSIADASKELAGEERNGKEERASLGDLAGAVLKRGRAREKEEAEANERNTSPPVIGPAPPLATTGFAQGAVLRPAMRAARPAAPTQPSLPARSAAQPNDLALPHSNQGAPLPDVGPTVRRGVPFYFDPLEARPAADEADDALADRIGQVLREQARRQGVDLT